ncbi:methyltransferase domain protein [Ceratobasidium sp. AG-Ba]|nr:methyltransferase domain protein [Ceratobasidium sp. AG-Ba]
MSPVLELGSGVALPLLLASTLDNPPSIITLSDYPDESIIGNLLKNLSTNKALIRTGCELHILGYAWGTDVDPLLSHLPTGSSGYDILILSDLLHFDSSHQDILSTIARTLSREPEACVYLAAGLYTREPVRESFLKSGEEIGLQWTPMPNDGIWRGQQDIRSDGMLWSQEDLNARKGNVVAWIGRWKSTQ